MSDSYSKHRPPKRRAQPRFIAVWSLGNSIPAPSVRRAMFIARIGANIRRP